MLKKHSFAYYFCLLLLFGCSNDDLPQPPIDAGGSEKDNQPVKDHLFLVNDAANNRVFLMNKENQNVFEWQLQSGIGNDCYLMENGKLLALLQAEDPAIEFGGYGGILQIINPDFTVEWDYMLSNEDEIAHHDIEMLPNGNILAIVWVRKSAQEAQEAGFKEGYEVFPEKIVEIDPATNQRVWEWNSWDHLIQDFDSTKSNYGSISANPSKIDINYSLVPNGDIMHANGIDYDPKNDLIFLSVNFFSEVWVIDHSTTTEEAKTSSGGNFGKGGDLVYRFGNPEAYQNTTGKRLFHNNHRPNIFIENGQNRMLIFMNGNNIEQSTVYKFDLESLRELEAMKDNEPDVLWEFTHPDLYSPKVSGAETLPNGNILITVGTKGIWEVTPKAEVVWKFEETGFWWRTYPYHKDSEAIRNLNIN